MLPRPGSDREAMMAKLRYYTLEARTRSLHAQTEMAYYDWLGIQVSAGRISADSAESILQGAYGIDDAITAKGTNS